MVPGVILYAGRDPGLVQSRRLILQAEGYVVDVCDNTEEFVAKFLDGDYDLVLMCNSLRDGERERLTSLVHRFAQRTPVLLVCSLPQQKSRNGSEYTCTGEAQTILASIAEIVTAAGRKSPIRATGSEQAKVRAGSGEAS